MSPCEELADGGPLRPARGLGRAVDPEGAANSRPEAGRNGPRKARPGAVVRTPPRRAERRRASATMHAHQEWTRRLARLSLGLAEGRKGKTAYPGPQRIRATMLARFLYPSRVGAAGRRNAR